MSNSLHCTSFPLFQRAESHDNRQDLGNAPITDVWLHKPAPPATKLHGQCLLCFGFLCFWVSCLTTVWMRTSGLLTSTYDLSTPGIFIWNNFFECSIWFAHMMERMKRSLLSSAYDIPLQLLRNLLTNPFPVYLLIFDCIASVFSLLPLFYSISVWYL